MRKVLFLAGLLGLALAADSHVRIVRVSYVARDVEVSPPGASEWQPANEELPIVEAERVRTGRGGRAEIQLECGSVVRLAAESEVRFPRLVLDDSGLRQTTARLDSGLGEATLYNSDDRGFRFEFNGGYVTTDVSGSSFQVDTSHPDEPGRVLVLAGKAAVTWGVTQYEVRKDEMLRLLPGGRGSIEYYPGADLFALWSKSRDSEYRAALAQQHLHTAAAENVAAAAPPQSAGAQVVAVSHPPPPPPDPNNPPASTNSAPSSSLASAGHASSGAGPIAALQPDDGSAPATPPPPTMLGDFFGGGGHGGRGGRGGGSGVPRGGGGPRVPSCGS